ncbi:MAG: hypothetical protein AAF533_26340 [Acidobacteriota bacterium]
MSNAAAKQFFEKLNATPSMQQALLDMKQMNAHALATEQGFDCTEDQLRTVAAEELAGRPVAWLGRTVTWRPDVEDGTLVVQPVAEGSDVRLTASELDLVSAGAGFPCVVPDCPTGCGGQGKP